MVQLDKDPKRVFAPEESQDTDAMRLGTLVDRLLTHPNPLDGYKVVSEVKKPSSDQMITYCEVLLRTDGDYDEAHRIAGYKTSAEATRNNFEKTGKAYYDYLLEVTTYEGIIISQEMLDLATLCANTFTTHPFLKDYFGDEENGNIEILNQVPLFATISTATNKDVEVKGLLDRVVINHDEKLIRPADFKTTEKNPRFGFHSSYFYDFKYYVQDGLYNYILFYGDHFISELIREKGYRLEQMEFLVLGTKNPYLPYRFKGIGLQAIESFMYKNNFHKGVKQLIDEYLWHKTTGQYEYPKEFYETQGLTCFAIE